MVPSGCSLRLTVDQVGDRVGVEYLNGRLADALPYFTLTAGVGMVGEVRRLVQPADRGKASLKCLNDLADKDLRRFADELMAACGPPDRSHETTLPKDREQLVQVLTWNMPLERYFGRLTRPLTKGVGELNESAKSVVASC